MQILVETHGGARIIRFSNPPVNALSVEQGVVEGLRVAFLAAIADDAVEAILLTGGDRFCSGADIKDFDGAPERLDSIRCLFALTESSPKPIISAIQGLCLGGGLELALATHYRVAQRGSRIGFPEVGLGLLPGGGGTQRTPRLTGAAAALQLMLSGKVVLAESAAEMGLIDALCDGDPVEAAVAAIRSGTFPIARPTGAMPAVAQAEVDKAIALAKSAASGKFTLAQRSIMNCIDASARLDLASGLAFEADQFAQLMASDASRALRHGFFGRRTVARVPGLEGVQPQKIRRVTVIGGGLMGTGIASALLGSGLSVSIVEPVPARRAAAKETITRTFTRDHDKGRINDARLESQLAALSVVGSCAEAADADLFIEAVFEEIGVKKKVFEEIDRLARPGAILASNTSTLDLNVIAGFTSRPEEVVGMHFFSPANVMRLLEVVRGAKTSARTLASAMTFAKAIGKTGVVAGVCDGFIGNRIFEEYLRQAWFLLEEGALPQQLDGAIERFGMAMGPCRVMDLAGQDIGWNIRRRRAVDQPDRPYSLVPDLICELGRFGQKTGAGFYIYPDGRTPQNDPEVEQLIAKHSASIGLIRRTIGDEEIVERCILAMANEGAKILEEGIACRPVDIDMVYLDGYGFPGERGGPMFHADLTGLPQVLRTLKRYETGRHGWALAPSPLLMRLVAEGRNFEELNG
ncbi:3-hydroxyacyl-CoA dehydrogenase NAD-binding domain-containing protein [Methylobacterium aquaticum]|uniref:3-hydroxyacyl-CoA dehydrogenase NAD-binding domain-containing protein n=1 Tax=Methylobacterium aquaticum TaxID=270351 RepID=UPI003D167E04